MKYESTNRIRFMVLVFVVFLVFFDQLSKYMVRQSGGFYICNPYIAFGIKINPFLFWIFWIAIIIWLVFLIYRNRLPASPAGGLLNTCCLLLILSGASSNIIDRLYFGCVIDFIDLKFWPLFNLADSFIVLGAVMLIFSSSFKRHAI